MPTDRLDLLEPAGRHLASSTFVGWLNVELSLPIFRLALAVFIPWRGADGFDRPSGWHPR